MTRPLRVIPSLLAAGGLLFGCQSAPETRAEAASAAPAATQAPAAEKAPTAEEARAFAQKVNADLKRLWTRQATAEWIKSTHITDDTEQNAAWVNEEVLGYLNGAIKEAARFKDVQADPETARMLHLLRVSQALPAPADAAKRSELASTAAKLEGMYGKGEYCKGGSCRDLIQLSKVLAESRNYDELLDAWQGWRTVSPPMRASYERLVTLGNEGAREIGFANVGDVWKSSYDMPPAQFEQEVDRLWGQVKPLYDDLHCYVRGRLQERYGKDKVPDGKPIPAHLLGNMWSQEWNNIYPLVEPYRGQGSLDVSAALKARRAKAKSELDAAKDMVRIGEGFFTSLGLKPLPETFYARSQFVQPGKDRKVVCHASAWDVTYDNDLRIKMCIQPTEEDLVTIHHELGHNYYYTYYYQKPVLFQSGANDGFHEAIGDAITLSVTPEYLKKVGLLTGAIPKNDKALINLQMKDAMEKVSFLPFGLLVDKWRWDVYAGKTSPEQYNQAWWELVQKYQGVAPPAPRPQDAFDPGAKYHVPANVPYMRYFLARILQFQFHKALCETAGHQGPIHECSIYGNKAAGAKLQAMLELGASRPWPDALEAVTGTRQMDATPLVDYFQPLHAWLKTQNQGRRCGW